MSKSTKRTPASGLAAAAMRWLAGAGLAMLALLLPVHADAGTAAIDNSVQLDPFNPVPEIQFSHGYYGDCEDECGSWRRCDRGCYHSWRDCDHDCRYHEWRCEHGCRDGWRDGWRDCDHDCRYGTWSCDRGCRDGRYEYGRYGWRDCDRNCRYGGWSCEHDCRNNWYGTGWRDCDRDCREGAWRCEHGCAVSYREMLRDYDARTDRHDDQADRYDEQADRYDHQAEWYKHHVIDKDRWYDGHTWHIAPLLPLPDISLSIGSGARPDRDEGLGRYDGPPPGAPYGGPPPGAPYGGPPPGTSYGGPPPDDDDPSD